MTGFIVIENTPGYMLDTEPAEFEEYAAAVEYLNELAAEYANDESGAYRVEYGYASGDNLAAVMVYDDSKSHDLGRYIGVEIDNGENGDDDD